MISEDNLIIIIETHDIYPHFTKQKIINSHAMYVSICIDRSVNDQKHRSVKDII